MNKLEKLFYFDERVTPRKRRREILIAYLYLIFVSPGQLRYVLAWRRSRKPGRTPFSDKQPWLTYRAVTKLDEYLKPDMKTFEYGSGGTTLFLAERVKEHVAVEHHKQWYQSVDKTLKKATIRNVKYLLVEPTKNKFPKKNEYYRSTRERGCSFEAYVKAIDAFPDNYFDVVVVDGRARVACIRQAYAKVRHKGLLILDNSSRPDYFEAFLFMRKRARLANDYFGLIGYETLLMQTTFWVVDKMANEKALDY